ncbi:MAG TPA: hypothetical protein VFB78_16170 [Acidimicrobiales bacterium]|nr:hypothetical protein [Acidimicrobiales bacterium]
MPATTFCPSCGAEYLAGVTECADCQISLTETRPLAADAQSDVDEVVYDLSDWSTGDRSQLEQLLTSGEIIHRWEVGTDLVVLEANADAVELLLDEVEAAGAVPPLAAIDDEADDGDDEAVYQVMSDLFVAADRLQKDPSDAANAGDFYVAADAVAVTPAPFGIDRLEWQQVQELAASLATAMESDIDDDVLARDASALRSLLSRYM